jgi:hypothetical protein
MPRADARLPRAGPPPIQGVCRGTGRRQAARWVASQPESDSDSMRWVHYSGEERTGGGQRKSYCPCTMSNDREGERLAEYGGYIIEPLGRVYIDVQIVNLE